MFDTIDGGFAGLRLSLSLLCVQLHDKERRVLHQHPAAGVRIVQPLHTMLVVSADHELNMRCKHHLCGDGLAAKEMNADKGVVQ